MAPHRITGDERRVAGEADPFPRGPADGRNPGAGWPLSGGGWACCLIFLSPFVLYVLVMLVLYISGYRG